MKIKLMKKTVQLFGIILLSILSLSAVARTRTRILLTMCDNGGTQGQIMIFEVLDDGTLDYVRTLIHPFDGHCRIPRSACVVDGTVFVLEYAGYDNRVNGGSTDSAAPARILKYDLDGNFLGVHMPGIKTWSIPLCSGDYMTVSPDKQWLFVGCFRYFNYQMAFRYSVETGAYISNNGNQVASGLGTISSFNVAADYTLPLSDYRTSGGLYLYTNDMATAKWAKHETLYPHTYARTGYVDDSVTPRRLYVGGYNSGYKVFEEGNTTPLASGQSGFHVSHIAKIGSRIYLAMFDNSSVDMFDSEAPSTSTRALQSYVSDLYGLNKCWTFNAYEEIVPDEAVEIAHWKFDEPAGSAVFTNSISSKWPIRALNLNSGAQGVSGNAICFNAKYARGVIKNSGAMLDADYGVFFWLCARQASSLTYRSVLSSRIVGPNFWHLGFNNVPGAPWLYAKAVREHALVGSSAISLDDTWYHVGVVKKGNSITYYLNGEKTDEFTNRVGIGGFDSSVDFVLGVNASQNSNYLYNHNVPAAIMFMDELRVFEGAPTAEQVRQVYEAHPAPSSAPAAPTAFIHDSTVANGYGTVVAHAFANTPSFTAPSIVCDAASGRRWVSCGRDVAPSALDATSSFWYSDNGGSGWTSASYDASIAHATLFRTNGLTCALGKTVSDPASGGRVFSGRSYKSTYLNPTNECDISCGYQVVDVGNKRILATFTNDVNVIYFRNAKNGEPDLVSEQRITPGTLALENGRYVQPYLLGGKSGTVSFALDGDGRPVDFTATPAEGESSMVFSTPRVAVSYAALPGSDRPFAVKYDTKRNIYWALTTPNGTSLELYASKDGEEWREALTVFTVTDLATTRVANPAFDFFGRSLAVTFTLCCPDGGAATVNLDSPNYVMYRTIERVEKYNPWKIGFIINFQ